MPTREECLAALLAQPERTVAVPAQGVASGLLEEVTPQQLELKTAAIISTQAAGEALRQARQQRELSLRGAGEVTGRSAPRVKAIEATDTDIHLGTVVEHARTLGYAVSLTLTPLDGQGPAIRADLGTASLEDAPGTIWEGGTVLPAIRKKVRVQ